MAIYVGTVYKESTLFRQTWSNVYHISAPSVEDAIATLNTCRINEQNVSYSGVHFTYGTVREAVPGAPSRKQTFDTDGELDPAGLGGPLPLFCTVRVVFSDLTGKPEQKYLRLMANEANLSVGVWDAELVDYVAANYAVPMLGTLPYVGPSGEHPISAYVHPEVQNRQLGWHRRSRSGFRRGWVAV